MSKVRLGDVAVVVENFSRLLSPRVKWNHLKEYRFVMKTQK